MIVKYGHMYILRKGFRSEPTRVRQVIVFNALLQLDFQVELVKLDVRVDLGIEKYLWWGFSEVFKVQSKWISQS